MICGKENGMTRTTAFLEAGSVAGRKSQPRECISEGKGWFTDVAGRVGLVT